MKRVLMSLCVLFVFIFSVNVLAGQISCPLIVKCNFEKGTCYDIESQGWIINFVSGNIEGPDDNEMKLDEIGAPQVSYNKYNLLCSYYSDNPRNYKAILSIVFIAPLKLVGSKWQFSGFGRQQASCIDFTTPQDCSAEIA